MVDRGDEPKVFYQLKSKPPRACCGMKPVRRKIGGIGLRVLVAECQGCKKVWTLGEVQEIQE